MYHPIILCGDMNSVYQSPFYQFVTESELLNFSRLNRNEVSGQRKSFNPNKANRLDVPIIPESLGITDQTHFQAVVEKRNSMIEEAPKIEVTFGKDNLFHPFRFNSAYQCFDRNGDPFVTTCLPASHEFVDFIFYHNNRKLGKNSKKPRHEPNETTSLAVALQDSSDDDDEDDCRIEIVSTLELFTKKQVEYVLLPNEHYASDHFLLAVNFVLTAEP
jgi:hypothetical protein